MIKRLKKLARSGQWQLLYNRAKEISNLKLFDNAGDLSLIQSYFLYYLELYSSLYGDLAYEENFLNEEIIDDDLRCEGYLLYRKLRKNKEEKNTDIKANMQEHGVIFSKKKKAGK